MSPSLEARALTKHFAGTTAVADVSFVVESGEVVGLLGANGAGKTTTLRMLLGLLRPTSGVALLNGVPPGRRGRERLGYVPQGLGLYPELTVVENMTFAARAFGCPDGDLDDALAPVRDALVADLPLGLRRQLAFACALQHDPDVLVLDEPTSGVGPLARARLWDRIREQAQRGAGVLVTTHYMQEARQCDRLLLMADGAVIARGTEADIVDGTTVVAVRTHDWTAAFTALSSAGMPVTLAGRDVRVVDPDLGHVRAVLAEAGVDASLNAVTATIEERMAALAQA